MSKPLPNLNINLSNLTRQQKVIASIALSRLTFTELGRRLKISPVAARNLCFAETVPPDRRHQMEMVFEEYGIDVELLPPGVHIPLGHSRSYVLGEDLPNS